MGRLAGSLAFAVMQALVLMAIFTRMGADIAGGPVTVATIVLVVISIVSLVLLHPALAAVALVLFPFLGLMNHYYTRKVHGPAAQAQKAVGAVSAATGLGSHTTSVTHRYALPRGGAVIDSPGVRRYSVAHVDPIDVRHGYPELARRAEDCRYRDCAHVVEPGCAVREALEAGAVAPWRYANYRKLAGL